MTEEPRPSSIKRVVFSCLLFLIPFGCFVQTLCPGVYWLDTGEFQAALSCLGLPHSPSFPSYVLISRPFLFLPIGDQAFRSNLSAAVFGGLIALAAHALFRLLVPGRSLMTALFVFFFALFAVCNPMTWYQCLKSEVYSLNLLVLIIIITIAIRILNDRESGAGMMRKWCLITVLSGFAFGNHSLLSLHLAPATGLLFVYSAGKIRMRGFWLLMLLFLLMTSIYLYLPVRSFVNPGIDIGNPENSFNFMNAVSRRGTFNRFFGNRLQEWTDNFSHYRILLSRFFPLWTGALAAISGIVFLARNFKTALFLWIALLTNIGITLMNRNFNANPDTGPAYLMLSTFLWLTFTIWGLHSLLEVVFRKVTTSILRQITGIAVITSFVILLTSWISMGLRTIGLQNDHSAGRVGRAVLENCLPQAVIFTGFYENFRFVLTALQIMENLRTDVRIIDRGEILYWPGGLESLKKRNWDLVKHEFLGSQKDDLEYLAPRGSRHSERIPQETARWILFTFLARIAGKTSETWPVYWFPSEDDQFLSRSVSPYGLFLRISDFERSRESVLREDGEFWIRSSSRIQLETREFANSAGKSALVDTLTNLGNSLDGLGHPEYALRAYDRALSIDPDSEAARSNRDIVFKRGEITGDQTLQ